MRTDRLVSGLLAVMILMTLVCTPCIGSTEHGWIAAAHRAGAVEMDDESAAQLRADGGLLGALAGAGIGLIEGFLEPIVKYGAARAIGWLYGPSPSSEPLNWRDIAASAAAKAIAGAALGFFVSPF